MNSPQDIQNLNSVLIIFILSFSIALIIVGVLLSKFRLWDRKNAREANKPLSHAVFVGKILTYVGAILTFTCLIFAIANACGVLSF